MTKRIPDKKRRALGRRGSVPMFAVGIVPAIVFLGIVTVRAANGWVIQARLQSALDAGALAGARDIGRLQNGTEAEKQAALDRIKALVAGIYNDNAGNSTKMSANDVTINVNGDKVDMSGSVNAANPVTGGPRPIVRNASATRSNSGLELALVFDITLSMTATDAGGGQTRIDAARLASEDLLKILYDDLPPKSDGTPNANNKKWIENLFISVVPFATAVNYGTANAHFLGAARSTDVYSKSWSGSDTSWGGCVEMRDVSSLDNTPTGSAGLTRFFSPSTYDASKKSSSGDCRAEAAYKDTRTNNPSGTNGVCMGHNDWTAPQYVFTDRQNTLIKRMVPWSSHVAAGIDPWAVAHGPNMMCPTESTHSVLPLTRDRATVEARIDNMTLKKLPFSAGTNIAPGLQAGWFTLSPNWRKVENGFKGWTSAEPATTTDTRPPLPALPLDYHLPNRQKVLILLTDGDNDWFSARDFQTDDKNTSVNESLQLVRPESAKVEGFYGAYGNLRDRLVPAPTSIAEAETMIDREAEKWCGKIKALKDPTKPFGANNPEQITIYTISFSGSVSNRAKTVLTTCASTGLDGKKRYFHAPDAAKLKEIFSAIGAELSKLRLSQ